MDAGPREKQLRVQSTRSSSGCQTCKHRHVKCDEGRPRCQRCLKGRRRCDYAAPGDREPTNKIIIYTVPRDLSRTPDLLDSERHALHYFRYRAAVQMTAPFQSELWKDCVFQLAERCGFVMSALIALSSMHESFAQEADLRDRLQANAIHHYNKTIRDISQATEEELPVDAVLMTVIVFHSLDSLRGCYQRALQHAQSGVKIIGERLLSPGTRQQSPMDEALCRDFLALQNQIREFGNPNISRGFDTLKGFDPPPSDFFRSVEDAAHQFDVVYNEIYCMNDYCQVLQESGVDLPDVFISDIQPRFETISVRFRKWVLGMDRLGALVDEEGDGRQNEAFLLLRMYQSLFTAMINSFPTGDCFARFDEDLARALDLAEVFVKGHDHASESQSAFTLSLGVIPVLFVIAWRSNNGTIRDKSLELLALSDRREGVWDSKIAFRLAQRYVALKNQLAAVDGYTSDCIQLSEIRFDSETICRMTCVFVGPESPPAGTLMPFDGTMGERRHVEIIHLGTSEMVLGIV